MPRTSTLAPALCGFATALLVVVSVPGDSSLSRGPDLSRNVPGLDPVFAHHLVHDDASAFRRYCESVGPGAIRKAFWKTDAGLWTAHPDSYLVRFQALCPHLDRIATVLAELFGSPECKQMVDYRRSLGARGVVLNRMVAEFRRLQQGTMLPLDERLTGLRKLGAVFESMGYENGVMDVEGTLASLVSQRGDMRERRVLLHSALARARRLGNAVMTCQFLGEMGYDHRIAGRPDSMWACYIEGIAIADRHQLDEQALRLRQFLATHFLRQSRFAVAAQLVREGQEACRRWGGGQYEIRALLWEMSRYADLGCWDMVRSRSLRLPALLRMIRENNDAHDYLVYWHRARRWEAQLLVADGNPAAGAKLLADLAGPVLRTHGAGDYGPLLGEWAEALLAAGEPEEALRVADHAIAYADSQNLRHLGPWLWLIRGQAALAVGDLDRARAAAQETRVRMDTTGPSGGLSSAECDALELRIALARGDRHEARRTLDRSLEELRGAVRRLDAGPHSYLALGEAEDLREAGHRLLADDALGSYRFELDWRSLPGCMGRSPSLARAARRSILDPDNPRLFHLVYGFTGERLTRWTVASGVARREILAATRADCDRRVEQVIRHISKDPGSADAPAPDTLRVACAELGRLLLPRELREGPPARVAISAEGSIARLPFEALDLGTGSAYEPVLSRHDVVYARPVPPFRRRIAWDSSIILVDGDVGRMPAAGDEAERAGTRIPGSRIVRSTEASKEALLDAWTRAPILYIAAHLARDQEAPLLCYFPMRFGVRTNHPDDHYLDLRDVRTVDLAGCRLAVLSSCASGEPYVVGGRSGPSMADALLDAGAEAVIHTRWQVRDDRAAVVAPQLAGAWLEAGRDPVSAWCSERRSMMRSAAGVRHPFEWAAWSVTVGLPIATEVGPRDLIAAGLAPGSIARDRRAATAGLSGSRHRDADAPRPRPGSRPR